MKVTQVRPGHEYQTAVGGVSLRFLADDDRSMVWVYTGQRLVSGVDVARFGGRLSATSIQRFLATAEMRVA
ncbi:MAG: hypothetical protein WAV90_13820 [Gordonia amarae]